VNIKPLDERIVVKFKEVKETTKSGIVLPDTAEKDKPQQGEIIAVGKTCCSEDGEPQVKVGDVVVFDKFAGTEVTLDDDDYVIVNIEDVLAVIEE